MPFHIVVKAYNSAGEEVSLLYSGGISAMPGHCESLAKNYDAEAEHFKSMAQTHRDLAK